MVNYAPLNLPPMIQTDSSNPFAFHTMSVRHPITLAQVIERNPQFSRSVQRGLELLAQDLAQNAPIMMLNLFPTAAPDYNDWANAYISRRNPRNPQAEPTWLEVDWFFAETLLFRLVVETVRWWEFNQDPYAPMKNDALAKRSLWESLEDTLLLPGGCAARLPELLRRSLWGNRSDLSYTAAAAHSEIRHEDLISDDIDRAAEHLLRAQLAFFPDPDQGLTHIITDNVGAELAHDLALADALITSYSDVVVLHVKYFPTYVSDATPADVREFLRRCIEGEHSGAALPAVRDFGERMQTALRDGRLRLAPNLFWNSSRFLWELPRTLSHVFEGAQLVILKGDMNYRRAIGDAVWEPTTAFSKVVDYFPVPLLALRTLKSDPIIGLPYGRAEILNDNDSEWRINGRYGVAQLHIPN
jgi:uncharacterized protein with ATP-grasp and redox domains